MATEARSAKVVEPPAGGASEKRSTLLRDHMNHDDDARIDEALEALARPQPPADHVARILARTSAERADSPVDTHDRLPLAYLRPRWVLPVAATLFVVLGATWQIERQAKGTLDDAIAMDVSSQQSGHRAWGAREEIVQPVLPPQAYWGMDPFGEFATLRPGTRVTAQGVAPVGHVRDSVVARSITARRAVADDELTWEPLPSDLPPIELSSIVPAPLVAPVAVPLEDLTLAEIPLAPIVIAPLDDQE